MPETPQVPQADPAGQADQPNQAAKLVRVRLDVACLRWHGFPRLGYSVRRATHGCGSAAGEALAGHSPSH